MSDIEMSTGYDIHCKRHTRSTPNFLNRDAGHPEGYSHEGGMGVGKGNYKADESMGDTSGAENETHDEDDDSEDEEALVVSGALGVQKTVK